MVCIFGSSLVLSLYDYHMLYAISGPHIQCDDNLSGTIGNMIGYPWV